jgi:hypothetical protein
VFAKLHSRRSQDSFSRPTPAPRPPSPNSHGILSLTSFPSLTGPVEILDSPSIVIPNPCAFGRVRDLLFVCPWPSREVNRASLTSFKSFAVNSFADPHPLNSVASIFYKNIGGRGRGILVLSLFIASLLHCLLASSSLSPLAATLMYLPASIANKRLTVWVSPLDATLTKTGGVPILQARSSYPLSPYLLTSLPLYFLYFITSLLHGVYCRPAGTRMASLMSVLAFLHDSRSP